jgi:hypothetical protein
MDIVFHYPPELLNLLKETIPKLCKSKSDLLNFFQGAGVSQSHLAPYHQLLASNKGGFSKYTVTRELLVTLNQLGERSLGERRSILKRVTDVEDFSGCWENDRAAAIGLVAQVRSMVAMKDSFTRMNLEREDEKKRRIAVNAAALAAAAVRTTKIQKVRGELFALFGAKDPHKRGKDLESVMNALFAAYDILVREAFSVKGVNGEGVVEQIDGLVELDGILYLVELKWWTSSIGVAEIAPHLVRLFSRGGQARGIFISYSDFTEPAVAQCREGIAAGAIIALCKLEEIIRLLDSPQHLRDMLKAKIQGVIADKKPFTQC